MTQKQFYESPSAELLVVRFEENIMSPQYGSNSTNATEYYLGGAADDGYEEL